MIFWFISYFMKTSPSTLSSHAAQPARHYAFLLFLLRYSMYPPSKWYRDFPLNKMLYFWSSPAKLFDRLIFFACHLFSTSTADRFFNALLDLSFWLFSHKFGSFDLFNNSMQNPAKPALELKSFEIKGNRFKLRCVKMVDKPRHLANLIA